MAPKKRRASTSYKKAAKRKKPNHNASKEEEEEEDDKKEEEAPILPAAAAAAGASSSATMIASHASVASPAPATAAAFVAPVGAAGAGAGAGGALATEPEKEKEKEKEEEDTLDAKCEAFWKSMKHPSAFTKTQLKKLRAKMKAAFAKPIEYGSARKKHKFAYLKSLLPCITDGCMRDQDDIQCQRADYLEERHLRSTSLGEDTDDLWGFLMNGLPGDKFSYEEVVYLLHIAIRHGGIHGGEWDAAVRTEGIRRYPMEYMARESLELLRLLPDECMQASAEKFKEKSDACIAKRAELGLPAELSTRMRGVYYGCTNCDTEGTKLDKKTELTLCCNAKPDGYSFCVES